LQICRFIHHREGALELHELDFAKRLAVENELFTEVSEPDQCLRQGHEQVVCVRRSFRATGITLKTSMMIAVHGSLLVTLCNAGRHRAFEGCIHQ
jgi:hypothetical protein